MYLLINIDQSHSFEFKASISGNGAGSETGSETGSNGRKMVPLMTRRNDWAMDYNDGDWLSAPPSEIPPSVEVEPVPDILPGIVPDILPSTVPNILLSRHLPE